MILIDPDLDPDPPPNSTSASAGRVCVANFASRNLRLPSTRTLSRFLAEAQAAVRLRGQVTVLLTTDAAIRGLNRRFRGKNKPTDVLSFPAANLLQSSKPAERVAGDIAISVETARRQAMRAGPRAHTRAEGPDAPRPAPSRRLRPRIRRRPDAPPRANLARPSWPAQGLIERAENAPMSKH